jgi:peptidoglycan/xylan/chitin deacetylase (PgdA/CDA1 family)
VSDAEHFLFERYHRHEGASPAVGAYYRVRPLLPRRLQIALRRAYSLRQRRRAFPAWPIEDVLVRRWERELRAEAERDGVPAVPIVNLWPGEHRFAFVLTHDVEGPEGVVNIPRLREVEARRGLVSSWNVCAEQYPIPGGLFDDLRAQGCEIGLHGIDHRGLLFSSRERFEADLPKVHRYLREWGAAGFRSPALHRNADWMPELGCDYDSSFPDTDPFEPQPGGCCSILPFFNRDMVELPVTMAQDHTLFEILRHRHTGVWRRKADWIAAHHGLVNVIVHPDYMGTPERLALYEELLDHLTALEGGWHALPRDVAAWWRARRELHVEVAGGRPRVAGPGAERATVALARPDGDGIVLETAQPAWR